MLLRQIVLFTDYSKPKIPQEYLGFDRVEQNYPILADDTCGTCICKKAERPGLYRLSSGAIPRDLFQHISNKEVASRHV